MITAPATQELFPVYPSKLLQELRLMKDQPNHRFYAACTVAVLVVVVPACAFVMKG